MGVNQGHSGGGSMGNLPPGGRRPPSPVRHTAPADRTPPYGGRHPQGAMQPELAPMPYHRPKHERRIRVLSPISYPGMVLGALVIGAGCFFIRQQIDDKLFGGGTLQLEGGAAAPGGTYEHIPVDGDEAAAAATPPPTAAPVPTPPPTQAPNPPTEAAPTPESGFTIEYFDQDNPDAWRVSCAGPMVTVEITDQDVTGVYEITQLAQATGEGWNQGAPPTGDSSNPNPDSILWGLVQQTRVDTGEDTYTLTVGTDCTGLNEY